MIQARYGFDILCPTPEPRYNIAPGQHAPVVVLEEGRKVLQAMQWGLVPSWAKDPAFGAKTINARAETVSEKPTFRKSFSRRRCLVLTDGFYEWRKEEGSGRKIPMRFVMKDGEPFAFAGLWDRWESPDGEGLDSFTIVTTAANTFIEAFHHRMPVILSPDDGELWLDPETDPEMLLRLLVPCDPERLKAYDVSTLVNSPKNDIPECIQPVDDYSR